MDNQTVSFKTALKGFDKDDVINYIEQMNNRFRKMEASHNQELEKLRNDLFTNESSGYASIISDLKSENEKLKKQLDELKPDTSREKAELYDKMSGQLGSMIIMANEKADDIIETANKKVDDAKQEIRFKIDALNSQLYNEFIIAVDSYTDDIIELNKTMNNVIELLNVKSEEIKDKFEKKNDRLKQTLINEINSIKLFNSDYDKI